MMELLVDILKWIYNILEIITPVLALPVIGIVGFLIKRRIDSYFQKNFLHEKKKFDEDLATYRSNLHNELEEYKIGIDTRKHLSIKMSDKRIAAYQSLLEALVHVSNKAISYNKNPCLENTIKVFSQTPGKGDDFLQKMESNTLFYSKSAWNHYQREIVPIYMKVIDKMKNGKPIDVKDINLFKSHIRKFKEFLLSEIHPDDPVN